MRKHTNTVVYFVLSCFLSIFSTSTIWANDYKRLEHPWDFNFVWGNELSQYKEFTVKIADKQFAGENFGHQGSIDEKCDWERKVISYTELKERLIHTANTIYMPAREVLIARAK
ncbi:hypothetical protein [Candidatus Cyrtobacter comes]|nr:hypothetical protein [Candidatus Cyrtobacter comes]